MGFHKTLNNL